MGRRREEAARVDQDITKKAQQVSDLTRQIGELQQLKAKLLKEMEEQKAGIESVRAGFYATLKGVTGQIEADVAKVKNYLMTA